MIDGKLKKAMLALGCAALVAAPLPASADPPAWAPAHGWRAKHNAYKDGLYFLNPISADIGQCNRELIGGVLGGVAGGVIGSTIGDGDGRTIATVTGAVLGLLLGGAVGRSMDEVDRACYGETFETAPDGSTVSWDNPGSGANYQVSPQSSWQSSSGQYCREYVSTAQIGGQAQTIYGTACREPDGTWRLTN